MSLNNRGDSRSRRRRKKDDYITPSLIFAAILLAVFYLYMRWRDNRITQDEIITVSIALVVAVIAFICYLPAVQHWFDRMEHERKDAEQRRFWEKREAKERAQRLKEQEAEEARAVRRAQRREEALQRQLQQSQSASTEDDANEPSSGKPS